MDERPNAEEATNAPAGDQTHPSTTPLAVQGNTDERDPLFTYPYRFWWPHEPSNGPPDRSERHFGHHGQDEQSPPIPDSPPDTTPSTRAPASLPANNLLSRAADDPPPYTGHNTRNSQNTEAPVLPIAQGDPLPLRLELPLPPAPQRGRGTRRGRAGQAGRGGRGEFRWGHESAMNDWHSVAEDEEHDDEAVRPARADRGDSPREGFRRLPDPIEITTRYFYPDPNRITRIDRHDHWPPISDTEDRVQRVELTLRGLAMPLAIAVSSVVATVMLIKRFWR